MAPSMEASCVYVAKECFRKSLGRSLPTRGDGAGLTGLPIRRMGFVYEAQVRVVPTLFSSLARRSSHASSANENVVASRAPERSS